MTGDPTDRRSDPPVLRVLSGDPTAADLAVITAILAAATGRTSTDDGTARPAASGWAAHWRQVRPAVRPGPGAWRASARPR